MPLFYSILSSHKLDGEGGQEVIREINIVRWWAGTIWFRETQQKLRINEKFNFKGYWG